MTATNAQVVKVVAELNVCQCGRFAVIGADGSKTRTGCTRTTKRLFAPGHDARLKGILIRAGVAGQQVIREGEGNNSYTDPVQWGYSFGFGHLVEAGIKLGRDKAATKKQPKVAAKPVATEQPGRAKVGRWEREGMFTVLGDKDLSFAYVDKKGELQTTDKFTRI